MLVTLLGIVTLVKKGQKAKAYQPMLVTLFGIVMLVKDLQSLKAKLPMLVTGISPNFDGIVSEPNGSDLSFVIVAVPLLTLISQV